MKARSIIERFEDKFIPVTETGCWIWLASSHSRGYGLFHTGRQLRKSKMEFAHRFSYELYKGYQPNSDEHVCHKCDNPSCVNPDHLFLGTHADNMQDMINKGRLIPSKLRLEESDIISILQHTGTNVEVAKLFGIDSGYCSRLRRGLVKYWSNVYESHNGSS